MFLCGPVGDVRDQPAASRRHQLRGMLTGDECGTDTGGYHGVSPPDPLLPPHRFELEGGHQTDE